jgi:UDPglucose 6-dehydrogenase
MDIAIIGSGYVGLVTGACFADVGHNVICVDNDERKVKSLLAGHIPIFEPGLEELVHRNVSAHRLHFTSSIEEGVDRSQVVFIAVPTPPQADGSVDMTYIEQVAREIAAAAPATPAAGPDSCATTGRWRSVAASSAPPLDRATLSC